jgi:hypothetical protein
MRRKVGRTALPRHTYSLRVLAIRTGTSVVGAVLFAYGLIAALSPLPAGAPLVIVGLLLIAAANPGARPLIRRLRRRWRWFDRLVRMTGKRGPAAVRAVAAETAVECGDER